MICCPPHRSRHPDSTTALDEVQQLCRRLRALLMAHPGASRVMAPGPSQAANERAFTERVLHLLNTAGLTDQDTALAYHALVEYVVGSATIDTDPRGGPSADKEQQHEAWRLEYARSAPEEFPATTRLAQWLYPSQEAQFDFGLELLIQSVRVRAESSPQRS